MFVLIWMNLLRGFQILLSNLNIMLHISKLAFTVLSYNIDKNTSCDESCDQSQQAPVNLLYYKWRKYQRWPVHWQRYSDVIDILLVLMSQEEWGREGKSINDKFSLTVSLDISFSPLWCVVTDTWCHRIPLWSSVNFQVKRSDDRNT